MKLTQIGIKSLYDSIEYYDNKVKRKSCQFSVVVVDDGSTDGSSEWINMQYPYTHILKGDGNLWWSGAINKGATYAVNELKADYIVLWNDDTICDLCYFEKLDSILKTDSKHRESILVSKVYWLDKLEKSDVLFNYGCYFSRNTGKKRLIGYNERDTGQFNETLAVDWSGGMGTVIPSSLLKEINYFDADMFPQYHGDIDFFLRANKKGYKSYAVPLLKIYNNPDSTGVSKINKFSDLKKIFLSNRSNHNIRQNFLFNKRHSNTLVSWGYFTLNYFALAYRILIKSRWA